MIYQDNNQDPIGVIGDVELGLKEVIQKVKGLFEYPPENHIILLHIKIKELVCEDYLGGYYL